MGFWKWFRQLSPGVQVTIIFAVLALLLAIAFDKNAGSNLAAFLQDVLVILGGSAVIQLIRITKGQNDSSKKDVTLEEKSDTDEDK